MSIRQCIICESSNNQALYQPSKSPGPVVKCTSCGFVFINPITDSTSLIYEGPVLGDRPASLLNSNDLHAIEGSWEEPIINEYIKEISAKRKNAKEALDHLDNHIPQKGKILDFGCFCGVFLSVAKENNWDSYGLEPLVMPSIYARAKFGLNVTTDTLRDDSFPTEYFDVITAFQVFEHIVNPAPELEKLKKFLKTDGYIMIEVPNIDTKAVQIMGPKHRHFVQDHVSFFSAETLSQLLENAGFDVCEVYYPVRVLSLGHMAGWVSRLTSQKIGTLSENLLAQLGIQEKTIRLGIGDIVSVIARKR